MKYNFDIDINNDNISTSLIIRQVKKGSTVLEFGPAAGYMTKYMKEQLNCNVYTVEIDKEAAQIASAYSVECMVGNIEDYEWLKKFNNIKFIFVQIF